MFVGTATDMIPQLRITDGEVYTIGLVGCWDNFTSLKTFLLTALPVFSHNCVSVMSITEPCVGSIYKMLARRVTAHAITGKKKHLYWCTAQSCLKEIMLQLGEGEDNRHIITIIRALSMIIIYQTAPFFGRGGGTLVSGWQRCMSKQFSFDQLRLSQLLLHRCGNRTAILVQISSEC